MKWIMLVVLTYNVHGLSQWVVSDDPEARMPEISARLNHYDVALIQESWEYWDALAARATHTVKERGNGPDPGTFFQNGLTTFARPRFVALSRGSLGACAGWLGGENDCLADKGFLRLRLRLEDGIEVDFWNVHLDAGRSDEDRAARARQLESLEERIRAQSADAPLVVGGDFNSSADDPADRALFARFRAGLSLEDTGVRSDPAGRFAGKHIDYLLFRGGGPERVKIRVALQGEAPEFARDGLPLSDHPALAVRLGFARGASAP